MTPPTEGTTLPTPKTKVTIQSITYPPTIATIATIASTFATATTIAPYLLTTTTAPTFPQKLSTVGVMVSAGHTTKDKPQKAEQGKWIKYVLET